MLAGTRGRSLARAAGDDQLRLDGMLDCQGCHTLTARLPRRARCSGMEQCSRRMGRYRRSMPSKPQLIVTGGARSERPRVPANMMDAAANS